MKLSLLLPIAGATQIDVVDGWVAQLMSVGMSSFWLRDLPALAEENAPRGSGLDPFVYASHLYQTHGRGIELGIGVARSDSRSPVATAHAAASLSDMYQSRLRLGVGAGESNRTDPEALRAYVSEVSALLRGERTEAGVLNRMNLTDRVLSEVWVASGGLDAVLPIHENVDGWMTWQRSIPKVRETITSIAAAGVRLQVACTLNVEPRADVTAARWETEDLRRLLGSASDIVRVLAMYEEAGCDECILRLTSDVGANDQVDELARIVLQRGR